jgi:hypothetical protein
MTSQDSDHNKPAVRHTNWGVLPILLAAAVVVAGTLFYINLEDSHPLTGRDAPAITPTPGK